MSILLEKLHKHFGTLVVVDQVSLEVAEGELFVLLGTSGSGKSTLLRLVAGLLPPDSGRIVLHGRDVTNAPPQVRGTGFVFQNYSVFRHMSVSQNIEFGLRIRKVSAPERARRRDELLELVGMGGLGNRYAHELSGGQQQRVALARALAYEPAVLLLDEPFGALDVKTRAQLRRSLREVQRALGVTAILVTHDQDEAFELGDRIGVLDRGRLLEVGQPEALYSRPRTQFAATFVGAGTVLAGTVRDGRALFGPLALPLPSDSRVEEGGVAQVLFRPEHVALTTEQPPDHAELLGRGRVIERGFAGPLRRIRLRLPRLPNTRQVAPAVGFGEEGLIVDAVVPTEEPASDDEFWASLRSWHLLDRPEARILAIDAGGDLARMLVSTHWMAQRLDARITLLGVSDNSTAADSLKNSLEKLREEHAPNATEVRTRIGNLVDQVDIEQHETLYDFIVLAAARGASTEPVPSDGNLPERVRRRVNRLGSDVAALVARATSPIIVLRNAPDRFRRLLVCTAVGEPGKHDVRVAGRLARRFEAEVTLLHVTAEESDAAPLVRDHLLRAVATMRALDVPAEARIRPGRSPAHGILDEARDGNFDLIVLGRLAGPVRYQEVFHDDVVLRILLAADRPVLVVPFESH